MVGWEKRDRNAPAASAAEKQVLMFPCPDYKIIKKEIWLRDKGEVQFYKLFWDPAKRAWVDQFDEVVYFKP
jgi:hypothetical protein